MFSSTSSPRLKINDIYMVWLDDFTRKRKILISHHVNTLTPPTQKKIATFLSTKLFCLYWRFYGHDSHFKSSKITIYVTKGTLNSEVVNIWIRRLINLVWKYNKKRGRHSICVLNSKCSEIGAVVLSLLNRSFTEMEIWWDLISVMGGIYKVKEFENLRVVQ